MSLPPMGKLPTKEVRLAELIEQLDEYRRTQTELRRRIMSPDEVPDSELTFHQNTLLKVQETVFGLEQEIRSLEKEK